jgi:hypothetical protein
LSHSPLTKTTNNSRTRSNVCQSCKTT